MSTYYENTIDEFGVSHTWHNAKVLDTVITRRDTLVEMIERPKWGIACYMNNSIQSCEVDEQIYHEALVHPVMSSVISPKRVMIIGGGEGATAREVLKWSSVKKVDMYEWDKDVVTLFKEKYPQWAKGAWDDKRLTIHYNNIFEEIKNYPQSYEDQYDVIIIDLFDPCEENKELWQVLLQYLPEWSKHDAPIVMYSGMRNILVEREKQPYQYLIKLINDSTEQEKRQDYWRSIPIDTISHKKVIIPYKVYIPSFSGESTFLLLRNSDNDISFEEAKKNKSHMTEEVWKSYMTLNW